MKNDKKEKTYFGVKESDIDEKLLIKIVKHQKISLIATAIFLPFVVLNLLLQLLHKYINTTVHLVFSSICIVVIVAVIVLEIVYLVNICKLKKQVKQTQKTTEVKKNN